MRASWAMAAGAVAVGGLLIAAAADTPTTRQSPQPGPAAGGKADAKAQPKLSKVVRLGGVRGAALAVADKTGWTATVSFQEPTWHVRVDHPTADTTVEFNLTEGEQPLGFDPSGGRFVSVVRETNRINGEHALTVWKLPADGAKGSAEPTRWTLPPHAGPNLTVLGGDRVLCDYAELLGDGTLRYGLMVYDPAKDAERVAVKADDQFDYVAVSPNGERAVTWPHTDGIMRCWAVDSGTLVWKRPLPYPRRPGGLSTSGGSLLKFTADGKTLAFVDRDAQRVLEQRRSPQTSASVNSAGMPIRTGSDRLTATRIPDDAGDVRLLDATTGQERQRLSSANGVWEIGGFSADGRLLVGADDGRLPGAAANAPPGRTPFVRVWDVATGRVTKEWPMYADAQFLPGTSTLAVLDGDGVKLLRRLGFWQFK